MLQQNGVFVSETNIATNNVIQRKEKQSKMPGYSSKMI